MYAANALTSIVIQFTQPLWSVYRSGTFPTVLQFSFDRPEQFLYQAFLRSGKEVIARGQESGLKKKQNFYKINDRRRKIWLNSGSPG
jgi:hypothetical protein